MQMTFSTMLPRSNYSRHEKMTHFGEILAGVSNPSKRGSQSAAPSRTGVDYGLSLHGEHDGDIDNFGVPERLLRQNIRKGMQHPITVIDACVVCDEESLCEILKKGVTKGALNKKDPKTGRTGLAYACAQGYLGILDILAGMGPILDVNAADNEGNTPLHLAAEADSAQEEKVKVFFIDADATGENMLIDSHADVLSNLLAFFRDVQIDARNHSGLTPLMKAAIQGRTNCAKILLFAGACPALRDGGRCLCASEWAKLCGRHTTADIIDRFPHTSCLMHPAQPGASLASHERMAPSTHRLVQAASGTPQSARRPSPVYGSPTGLTVRRAYRAASEPNLQTRNSVQLNLEQIQQMQPVIRRKPSWIRRKLSRALGIDKQQRSSLLGLASTADQLRYASSPSLQGLNTSAPFSCHNGQYSSGTHGGTSPRPRSPMIVPKVKIHHSDSVNDAPKSDSAEKKHKLDLKKMMMFRKRSSSSGKIKKI